MPIISRDRHHRASAQVYDLAEIQQSRPGRMFVFAFIWGERKGARGKEPAMSEDEIMEVKYISGIQPFMDEEGETVLAVSWVECPMMKTKRITMRTAASRETAERFCRDLMKLLGIQEQRMVGTTSSDD